MTGERYALCPQLAAYDELLPELAPYLTFAAPRRHRSTVVNTDSAGFRISHAGSTTVDVRSWPPEGRLPGVVLGGSFVFGVGATSDQGTLVSRLNARLPHAFLNLGIRAGNSTQELCASIPFLDRADCIVICSGINTLLVNLQSLGVNELFGPFFGEGAYESLRDRPLVDLASLVTGGSSGLGFKRLAREALARTRRRAAGALEERTQAPLCSGDWDAATARALAVQERDLRMLARARRPGSTILFAAQPFAPCCTRVPAPEEQRLFDVNDRMEGPAWQVTKEALMRVWPPYVSALSRICADIGVSFADLRTCELTGWSFVDRIHMTDAGYDQAAGFLATHTPLSKWVS